MLSPRLVAAAAAAFLLLAAPASAADLSQSEVQGLARQARTDPGALEELKNADSIEGQPVDLRQALEGADESQLERRLETLERIEQTSAAPSSAEARSVAEAILAQPRYESTTLPRPLHRPLAWLGQRIESVVDAFPGGPNLFWTVLCAVLLAIVALASLRIARRRAAVAVDRSAGRPGRARELTPAELERRADDAERAGDYGRALRLRFVAGLLRLDRATTIALRDSLTTGELRRRMRSDDFDRLARRFDEIVYGEREARREDVEESKADWRRVLEVARA